MSLVQEPVEEFLARLASGAATPGGGSAAAVMGAMAAALVSMVCNVTLSKKGMEAVEPDMHKIRAESEALRLRLTSMVALDVAAFDALMAAYKLPKAADEEKARRAAAIQASLTQATVVPLDCARDCAKVIGLARRAGELGYKAVVSDAGVGVLSAYAALRSAALNVHINAPALTDRAAAEQFTAEIDALVESAASEQEAVYRLVRARL